MHHSHRFSVELATDPNSTYVDPSLDTFVSAWSKHASAVSTETGVDVSASIGPGVLSNPRGAGSGSAGLPIVRVTGVFDSRRCSDLSAWNKAAWLISKRTADELNCAILLFELTPIAVDFHTSISQLEW